MLQISKGLIIKQLKMFITNSFIMNSLSRLPPFRIPNYITSPRKMSYEQWLDSPVMDANYDSDGNFRNVCTPNGDYYTHKHFIIDFYTDLLGVIHKAGFNIENEKEFKRKVAIFVYRLSRERL